MTSRRRRIATPLAALLGIARGRAAAAVPLLALAAAGCAAGTAGTKPASPAGDAAASLCAPPASFDTTALRRVDRGDFSVGVPKQFAISGAGSDVDEIEFRSVSGRIVLLQGNYPALFNDGEVETRLRSTCMTVIDDRPVEIVEITYALPTAPLHAPDPMSGVHSVVGARWNGVLHGRDVAIWIDTKSPPTSRRLRSMFWTVRFVRDSANAQGAR